MSPASLANSRSVLIGMCATPEINPRKVGLHSIQLPISPEVKPACRWGAAPWLVQDGQGSEFSSQPCKMRQSTVFYLLQYLAGLFLLQFCSAHVHFGRREHSLTQGPTTKIGKLLWTHCSSPQIFIKSLSQVSSCL